MNKLNVSLIRKVIYLCIIALLLIPLYQLGLPASYSDGELKPGGQLAQMRTDYHLSPAQLGEIDPASESMKLATLGLRGVAANILWARAQHYKKTQQWDKFSATLNQITKLQPHFYNVWDFQSHNIAYNVSVEFDDYRYRYHWVKKGINFLIEGTKFNRNEPRLYQRLGWFMGQKFGRADEHVQFRHLFRDDEDFHKELDQYGVATSGNAYGPEGKPDNWLCGLQWYDKSYDLVDKQGVPIRGQAAHLFYNHRPMSHMNFSTAISEEGHFQYAKDTGWKNAHEAHIEYGEIEMPSTWGPTIRLNNYEQHIRDIAALTKKLDEIAPGKREELVAEKVTELSPELRNALDVPDRKTKTTEDWTMYREASRKIQVSNQAVATRASATKRREALETASEIGRLEFLADIIDKYRAQLNFEYWRTRAHAETQDIASEAREKLYLADQQMKEALDEEARANYQDAWRLWADLCKQFPLLLDDTDASDITTSIENYLVVLDRTETELPDDFPLIELLELHRKDVTLPTQLRTLIRRLVDIQAAGKAAAPKTPESTDPPAKDPQEPTPSEPAPTDPAPTDPAPTDPAPTDPAPTDPAPTDPAPTDPAP
ncbi:MAG: hypothetical protein ACI9G1_000424, partial [Pirellulaceae bacterium]